MAWQIFGQDLSGNRPEGHNYLRVSEQGALYIVAVDSEAREDLNTLSGDVYNLSGQVIYNTNAISGLMNLSGISGAITFIDLIDTPLSYSGSANKFVKVNQFGNAVEFVAEDLTNINALSAAIDANSDDILAVTTTVADNSASWAAHSNYDSQIASLSSAIDQNTLDISSVTATVSSNSGNWDSVYSTVEDNSAAWSAGGNYDAEIASLSSAIDDVTTTVADNSASWAAGGNYDSEIAFLSTAIDTVSSDLFNLNSTVSTNSADWSAGANYDAEISFLSSAIDTVSSDLFDVTSTVSTNSAQWANHSNYDAEISALSSAIGDNSTDILTISGDVLTNASNISNVSNNLNTLSAHILEVEELTNEPTGFSLVDTDLLGDISFDAGTLTFTIQPKAGQDNFTYFIAGQKYEVTTAKTVTITDTHGLWFIYFVDGVLTSSQTAWTFDSNKAFVAILYWDATGNRYLLGEERHGITMDYATHKYLHESVGAVYVSGFTPTVTADGDGSSNTHAEITSIEAGYFFDEDIKNSNTLQTTAQIWWKSGASSDWFWDDASAALVKMAATRPYYNQFTGGAWKLTELADNSYVLMHIFASNRAGTDNKIIFVMGENQYATKPLAQAGAEVEILSITTADLPTPEFVEIGTVILQTRDLYTNAYNARVVSTAEGASFIDFRKNDKIGVGASVTDHGNLTGLSDDDHTQYMLVNGTRAFTGTVGGVTPVLSADLTTKAYVDSEIGIVSSEIDTVSTDLIDVTATVASNSAQWANHSNYDSEISFLSSAIDTVSSDLFDVTATVSSNSADWANHSNYDAEISFLSSAIDSVSTDLIDVTATVSANSADWANHSNYDTEISNLSSAIDQNALDISSVTATVSANSADWGNHSNYDAEISFLSGAIEDNVAKTDSVYTTVGDNSASWGTGGNYDSEIAFLSSAIDDVTTTVADNSAAWGTGGVSYWALNSNTLSPVSAEYGMKLPSLSGTGAGTILVTDVSGNFQATESTITTSSLSGSIFNMTPFSTNPATSSLVAYDSWLILSGGTLKLKMYDGTNIYSVELSME